MSLYVIICIFFSAKNKKDVSKSHKPTTSHVTSSPVSNITNSPKSNKKKRNLMLTGRGVTTQMLIEEQILEPGEKALTIDYLVSFITLIPLICWRRKLTLG